MKNLFTLLLFLFTVSVANAQLAVNYNGDVASMSLFLHTSKPKAFYVNTDYVFRDATITYSAGVLANDNLGGVYTKLFFGPTLSTNTTNGYKYGGTLGVYAGSKHVYIGYRNTYGNSYNMYGSVSVLISY